METSKTKIIIHRLEVLVPWLVLIFLLVYSVLFFTSQPYVGYQTRNNEIVQVYTGGSSESLLKQGDVILQVNDIQQEALAENLKLSYYSELEDGGDVPLIINRMGETRGISYELPGFTEAEFLGRLGSAWFLPYLFWLAGTAALFFIRSNNAQRWLLTLACYLVAAWFSVNGPLEARLFGTPQLMRSLVWVLLPVILHLLWNFPQPLKALDEMVWSSIYTLCAVLATASWLQWLPADTYVVGLFILLAGVILILVAHFIFQPAERVTFLWLVVALAVAALPFGVVKVLGRAGVNIPFAGSIWAGVAAVPGFFFIALYHRQLEEAVKKRVERLPLVLLAAVLVSLLVSIGLPLLVPTNGMHTVPILFILLALVILLAGSLFFLLPPVLASDKADFQLDSLLFSIHAIPAAALVLLILVEMILVFLMQLSILPDLQPLMAPYAFSVLLLGAVLAALAAYPLVKRALQEMASGQPHALPRANKDSTAGK